MDSGFKLIFGAVVSLIVLVVAWTFWPLVSIPAGHVGVITLFGEVQKDAFSPGLHAVNPMAHVHDINTQVQKMEVKGAAASKDLQQIHTTIAVNFHLASDSVSRLYADVGMEYGAKIIDPSAQEAFKAVTAKYTATELIEKRADVKAQIQAALSEAVNKVSSKTIIVDEIFITNFEFTPSFSKAVEDKQTAEQRVLTEQRNLQRIEIEANQRIAQAKGEAEAIRIQAQSISAQGGAAYVNLKAIEKWNGTLPIYMVGGAPVPFIDVNKLK